MLREIKLSCHYVNNHKHSILPSHFFLNNYLNYVNYEIFGNLANIKQRISQVIKNLDSFNILMGMFSVCLT